MKDANDFHRYSWIKKLFYVQNDVLDLKYYTQFTSVFTPFPSSVGDGPEYLSLLEKLVKSPYFFGDETRENAAALINNSQKDTFHLRKRAPALVRISRNQDGQLCLCYYDEKKDRIENALMKPENYNPKSNFLIYAEEQIKNRQLRAVSQPTPFAQILKEISQKDNKHFKLITAQ